MTSAYTFAYMLAAGCAHALMYAHFVYSALVDEGGGVQVVQRVLLLGVWGYF